MEIIHYYDSKSIPQWRQKVLEMRHMTAHEWQNPNRSLQILSVIDRSKLSMLHSLANMAIKCDARCRFRIEGGERLFEKGAFFLY